MGGYERRRPGHQCTKDGGMLRLAVVTSPSHLQPGLRRDGDCYGQ